MYFFSYYYCYELDDSQCAWVFYVFFFIDIPVIIEDYDCVASIAGDVVDSRNQTHILNGILRAGLCACTHARTYALVIVSGGSEFIYINTLFIAKKVWKIKLNPFFIQTYFFRFTTPHTVIYVGIQEFIAHKFIMYIRISKYIYIWKVNGFGQTFLLCKGNFRILAV